MKLATLKNATRDGRLVVVSRDHAWALDASSVAPTLQHAIEHWRDCEPRLQALSRQLSDGAQRTGYHPGWPGAGSMRKLRGSCWSVTVRQQRRCRCW